MPFACFAATVELRGRADVDDDLAAADAAALLAFLRLRGAVAGEAPEVPPPPCRPTPLAGVDPLVAPVPGVVVYRAAPGDRVAAGEAVAEIVDPVGGGRTVPRARASGVLFARSAGRFAVPGRRLGKIAGAEPFRAGDPLGP